MALIHNERLKLLATGLNNLGIASIVSGIIAPTSNFLYGDGAIGTQPDRLVALGIVWLSAGFILIVLARHLLGGLKE